MTPDSGECPRGLIPRLLNFNDASWCYIQGVNSKAQEFEKVTIYTTGRVLFDCIVRIDARQARFWVAPFAQYKKSVHVEYVPKRGRRVRSFVVPSCYVVVVPITDAIDPDKLLLPPLMASRRHSTTSAIQGGDPTLMKN
jgi:hypothetical protein